MSPCPHGSLENLAAMEETVVRDKAVESACVVIGLMQGGQQEVMIGGLLTSYVPGQKCFSVIAHVYRSKYPHGHMLTRLFLVSRFDKDTTVWTCQTVCLICYILVSCQLSRHVVLILGVGLDVFRRRWGQPLSPAGKLYDRSNTVVVS